MENLHIHRLIIFIFIVVVGMLSTFMSWSSLICWIVIAIVSLKLWNYKRYLEKEKEISKDTKQNVEEKI